MTPMVHPHGFSCERDAVAQVLRWMLSGEQELPHDFGNCGPARDPFKAASALDVRRARAIAGALFDAKLFVYA